jgi:hypothetical protein
MNFRIRIRFELSCQKPAVRLRELDRLLVHPETFGGTGGENDLGAEDAHQPAPLDRETVRHRDDERVIFLRANHRKADAGIAAGGLDDSLSGFQRAVALGGLDDVEREPVLDGCGGIESFRLDVHAHPFRRDVVDADARGVSDRVQHAIEKTTPSVGRSDLRTFRHHVLPGGLIATTEVFGDRARASTPEAGLLAESRSDRIKCCVRGWRTELAFHCTETGTVA